MNRTPRIGGSRLVGSLQGRPAGTGQPVDAGLEPATARVLGAARPFDPRSGTFGNTGEGSRAAVLQAARRAPGDRRVQAGRRRATDEPAAGLTTKATRSAQGPSPFRTLRGTVLLVDGDPTSLAALARALLGSDFRVARASSAEEALAVLGREPVDVIVTELELRGMGGLELLGQARDRRPEAVRVILTGRPDLTSAISAINCEEVFRFLTKPVSRDQLLATVQLALARRGKPNPEELRPPASSAARRGDGRSG